VHAFDVVDVSSVHSLTLELLRDDGAAAYLNGIEIARSNLPNGAGFLTLATLPALGDDEATYFPFDVSPHLLIEGTNVLAVEVHQFHVASADLALDVRLFGDVAGPITDSVLSNDSDADGDLLTAVLVSGPAHGELSFAVDGSFIYTPDLDFVGLDTVTYRATDGAFSSNVATVTIDVKPQSAVTGDLNADGNIDRGDLAILIANYGMTEGAAAADGDLDGDGQIGVRDAVALRNAFTPTSAAALIAEKGDSGAGANASTGLNAVRGERGVRRLARTISDDLPAATDRVFASENQDLLVARRLQATGRMRA
jgi:hypothetical protein